MTTLNRLTPDQARTTLVGVRAAFAAGTWLAPNLTFRLFGVRAEDNPNLPVVARLFGTRDAVLGGMLATAAPGPDRERALRWGIITDAADVAAVVLAARQGSLPKPAAVLGALAAGSAVALGVMARG